MHIMSAAMLEMIEKYFVLAQAEELLGVTRSLVCRWCRQGRFPGAVQLPNGGWLIPKTAVHSFRRLRRKPGRPTDASRRASARNKARAERAAGGPIEVARAPQFRRSAPAQPEAEPQAGQQAEVA
jgi:predicted DNA-binding transcriptional regulator AlpA